MRWHNIVAGTALAAVTLAGGCRGLPSGTPPAGPVVAPPAAATAPLSPRQAVDRMITSLATRCPEIGAAGAVPPPLSRDFRGGGAAVDALPAEVWASLVRMGLIRAAATDSTAAYRLGSGFRRAASAADAPAGGAVRYRWRMWLERVADGGECWCEELTLAVPVAAAP